MKSDFTILIVEDDQFNIQLIETILSKIEGAEKVRILTTDEEDETFRLLSQNDVDLVLLDLHMPKADGKEILEKIRSQKETADIPVIIVSVDGLEENALRETGATDFILKPYDVDTFSIKLSKYLELRR